MTKFILVLIIIISFLGWLFDIPLWNIMLPILVLCFLMLFFYKLFTKKWKDDIVLALILALFSFFGLSEIKNTASIWQKNISNFFKVDSNLQSWWNGLSDEWHSILINSLNEENEKNKLKYVESEQDIKRILELELVDLTNARVRTLKPLSKLTKLHTVFCKGVPISDLQPLENLLFLRKLNISNTNVEDITPLYKLKMLQCFEYNNTNISYQNVQILETKVGFRFEDCLH